MAPLLLRPPAPPRPRYLQPEPTKNARVEMLAVLNKSEGVTCGAAQGDGQSEDTGLRTGNVVRPEEESPARNVEYFKNKQDIAINEVEVNQAQLVGGRQVRELGILSKGRKRYESFIVCRYEMSGQLDYCKVGSDSVAEVVITIRSSRGDKREKWRPSPGSAIFCSGTFCPLSSSILI